MYTSSFLSILQITYRAFHIITFYFISKGCLLSSHAQFKQFRLNIIAVTFFPQAICQHCILGTVTECSHRVRSDNPFMKSAEVLYPLSFIFEIQIPVLNDNPHGSRLPLSCSIPHSVLLFFLYLQYKKATKHIGRISISAFSSICFMDSFSVACVILCNPRVSIAPSAGHTICKGDGVSFCLFCNCVRECSQCSLW